MIETAQAHRKMLENLDWERTLLLQLKGDKAVSLEKWKEGNVGLLRKYDEQAIVVNGLEEEVRKAALIQYKEDGDKHALPGITIKVFNPPKYKERLAFEWALEHKVCLKLDVAAFKAMCPSAQLAFVTFDDDPRATIATDLSKALKV